MTPRSRATLHFNKLAAFRDYLQGRGWVEVERKSIYEALRMTHPTSPQPCIVHKKDSATEHCTTWGTSQNLLMDYLKQRDDKTGSVPAKEQGE